MNKDQQLRYTKFPHRVTFYRTHDWWKGGWRNIADWLETAVGKMGTDWEYMDEHFMFTSEEHKTMFILRWS